MAQLPLFDLAPVETGARGKQDVMKRVVSMSRVEIFVPAELMEIPSDLAKAFEDKFVELLAEHRETMSLYGLDLSRGLKAHEEEALINAWFHHGVYSRVFTR